MKNNPPGYLEKHRVRSGLMKSDKSDGMNGAFLIPLRGVLLKVIASDGTGWDEEGLPQPVWEHVSVSLRERCPT